MGREKLVPKYGCEFIKNLNDAKTLEYIRKAIKDGVEAKDHEKCLFSCPWKIWKFIEKWPDPHILLQKLVGVGEQKVETENFIKAINKAGQDPERVLELPLPHEPLPSKYEKALQDLVDPHEPLPTEVLKEVTSSILDLRMEILGSRKVKLAKGVKKGRLA